MPAPEKKEKVTQVKVGRDALFMPLTQGLPQPLNADDNFGVLLFFVEIFGIYIRGQTHHWQTNAFACQWCVRPPIWYLNTQLHQKDHLQGCPLLGVGPQKARDQTLTTRRHGSRERLHAA